MPFSILAQDLEVKAVSLPTVIDKGDYCWCSKFCPPSQMVFAGVTDKTNDKSSFIFKVEGQADTVVIKLWKAGAEIATLNDTTYGTYYNDTNESDQIYFGYLVNWKLVYDAFGAGEYQVKSTVTILSQPFSYESGIFQLYLWNEMAADQTVRIETYQNGYTESAEINFTGMNWYNQVRLDGDFKLRQPEFISKNYLDTTRTRNQIQDQVTDVLTLELLGLSDEQSNQVVYSDILANRIIITDYNLDNDRRYVPIEVYPDSIEQLQQNGNRPGVAALVLKFVPKQDNNLKRNIYF